MMAQTLNYSRSDSSNSRQNIMRFAKVHSILEETGTKILFGNVYYQPLENLWEVKELALLFKEWFPLDYPDEFFDGLLDNQHIKTIIACHDVGDRGIISKVILGCIMYESKPLDPSLVSLPLPYLYKKYHSIYILAIGMIEEARNKGIATAMINEVIQLAKKEENIKCIYLDVLANNKAAIRFYEKNDFTEIFERKGYYEIGGKKYNSKVLCLYFNGGNRPSLTVHRLNSNLLYFNILWSLKPFGTISNS